MSITLHLGINVKKKTVKCKRIKKVKNDVNSVVVRMGERKNSSSPEQESNA